MGHRARARRRAGCRPFGVTSNAVLRLGAKEMAERSAKTEAERRGISVEQVWRERADIYPQKRVLERASRAGDRVPLQRRRRGVNGEAITVALGGIW